MCIDSKLYNDIRYLYERENKSQRAIASILGISRSTVKKYIEGAAVPWERKSGTGTASVLKPEHLEFIKACLREDEIEHLSKQFHTARRIYVRLCEEKGFTGCESTVRRAVAEIREIMKTTKVFIPLAYATGEAVQIDWGEAKYYVNGERISLNYFCMRECFSGDIFCKAFYRQNKESFLEGLLCGFEHFGGIPLRVIFDNAKVAVKEGFGHCAKTQEYYGNFAAHYCFKPVFCNIASGNEKGLVENLVGYIRKNVLVPVPRVKDINELNNKFIDYCQKYREKHKIDSKDATVAQLMLETRRALTVFPPYRFDTSDTKTISPNEFSLVVYDRQKYSVPTSLVGKSVTVKAYGNKLDIHHKNDLIVSYTRQYGVNTKPVYKLEHYMALLEARPTSVYNARPIKDTIPPRLYRFIKELDDPTKIIRILKYYLEDSEHLLEMLDTGATFDAIEPLLQTSNPVTSRRERKSASTPPAPLHISAENDIKIPPVSLSPYDALIYRGGTPDEQ